MGKIKDAVKKKFKRTSSEVEVIRAALLLNIKTEEDEIKDLSARVKELESQKELEDENGDIREAIVSKIDFLTQEIDRKTKHVSDLLKQLETINGLTKKCEKEGKLTEETVFKSAIYLTGTLLVLHAEEVRPLISKGMMFLAKPKI